MNENVVSLKLPHKISDVTCAPFEPFKPLTITATVGEITEQNNFEIVILFGGVIRFDHSSVETECNYDEFKSFNAALDGFFVSENSSFLEAFRTSCDDFKEDATDSMWHYRIYGHFNVINIISQRDPIMLKIEDGELTQINSAEDMNYAH